MKVKFIFLTLLSFLTICNYGQILDKKIEFGVTINYALLGEGDFAGLYYDNSISYSISNSFDISASFGFLFSSNNGSKNILASHNDNHLLGDLQLILIPIKGENISVSIGLGYTNRFRAQTRLLYVEITNQELKTKYENITSFDIGYLGQMTIRYKASSKIEILLNGEYHSYNRGSGIASIGMGINHKF